MSVFSLRYLNSRDGLVDAQPGPVVKTRVLVSSGPRRQQGSTGGSFLSQMLRRRVISSESEHESRRYNLIVKDTNSETQRTSWISPISVLVLFLACVLLARMEKNPDNYLPVDDVAYLPDGTSLSVTSVKKYTELLSTEIGAHPTGTQANVKALSALHKQVDSILAHAVTDLRVTAELHTPTGWISFDTIAFPFTNLYYNITNLVVIIEPIELANLSGGALLINAHYDSVPESPGAGDDVFFCAVMLEHMRLVVEGRLKLRRAVVYLFNNAEENGLVGSHGYVSQHWTRHHIDAFVNLDSSGTGGREVLFQYSPCRFSLVREYQKTASYPLALSLAQEMFERGIIPSDTDFRIFQYFGNLSGVDIASVGNGYFYHTEFDAVNAVSIGSINLALVNVGALLNALLTQPRLPPSDCVKAKHAYLTFGGRFMLIMSLDTLCFISAILLLVAVLTAVYTVGALPGMPDHIYARRLMLVVKLALVKVTALVCTPIVAMTTGFTATLLGRSLFAFCWPQLIFAYYWLPCILVHSVLQVQHSSTLNQWILGKDKSPFPTKLYQWTIFDRATSALVYSILGFVLVLCRIASTHILLLAVACSLAGTLLVVVVTNLPKPWRGGHVLCSTLSIVCMLPSLYYTILMTMWMGGTLIPMLGRTGTTSSPETMVAMGSAVIVLLFVPFMVAEIFPLRYARTVSLLMLVCWILVSVVVLLGFVPAFYAAVCPKRLLVQHTQREFYAGNQTLIKKDHGVLLTPMDYKHLDGIRDVTRFSKPLSVCSEEVCPVPLYFLRLPSFRYHAMYPAPKPYVGSDLSVKVNLDHLPGQASSRLITQITGANAATIVLVTHRSDSLLSCSLHHTAVPVMFHTARGAAVRVLRLTRDRGSATITLWFDLALEGVENTELSVSTHHMEKSLVSSDLRAVLRDLPTWVSPTYWVSTYHNFTFQ